MQNRKDLKIPQPTPSEKKPFPLGVITAVLLILFVIQTSVIIAGGIIYKDHLESETHKLDSATTINGLTTSDLKTIIQRKHNSRQYLEFLNQNTEGEVKELLYTLPYDVLQQYVYNCLPTKQNIYDITLYKLDKVIEAPSASNWILTLSKTPDLQFLSCTEESAIPDYLKSHLQLGFSSFEVDGQPYLCCSRYSNVDLSNWTN